MSINKNQYNNTEGELVLTGNNLLTRLERFNYDKNIKQHIYVLKFNRLRYQSNKLKEDTIYYVGKSVDLHNRIIKHIEHNGNCMLPIRSRDTEYLFSSNSREKFNQKYILRDVIKIVPVENYHNKLLNQRAKYLERKTALKIAQEKDTTMVMGGH